MASGRFRLFVVLLVLLAPIVANGQSDPALWRFVYPDAKTLISIDWGRIRQSQTGALIRDWFLARKRAPALEIAGLELLNDVDRIVISSPGNNSPDEAEPTRILIAIYGRFEPAKLREVFTRFGAKPQAYNAFQVYRPQGKQAKDMAYVMFDGETILFGDATSIFAALDRNQFGPPPANSSSMLARAAQMEAAYDLWVITDATEILENDSVAALFRGGEWATQALGFEAGVNLRAGLAADITVRFSSDAKAKRMTGELTRVMNLVAKDKNTGAAVQDIARKLKFTADGSATRISLHLAEQEVEKSAQAFMESHRDSGQMAAQPGPNAGPEPVLTPVPIPAKHSVIRIEGLDDGPREIPYPDPRK